MAVPLELQPEVMLPLFEAAVVSGNALARYFPARPLPGPGNKVSYDVLEYQNLMTRNVARGGGAPRGDQPIRAKVTLEAPTFKEAIFLSAEELKDVRDVGSMSSVNRDATVARIIRQLKLNLERRMEWLRAQWITGGALVSSANAVPGTADGTVYMRPDGHAMDSPLSVSLGINSSHIDGAVAASWATSTTDIHGDLDAARATVAEACGVVCDRVILNHNTMKYINTNDDAMASNWAKDQLAQKGSLVQLWDYTFDVVSESFAVTTAEYNDTAGTQLLIPDNVVILTTSDNDVAGRAMLECEPSDSRAPGGTKGVFLWTDEGVMHPHDLVPGIEWTGCPMIQNTDALYIFDDVTSTS